MNYDKEILIGGYSDADKLGNFYYNSGVIRGETDVYSSGDVDSVKLYDFQQQYVLDKNQKYLVEQILDSEDKNLRKSLVNCLKEGFKPEGVEKLNKEYSEYRERRLLNVSVLGEIRHKLAEKFGLEKVKIPRTLAKKEKDFSDKNFGKLSDFGKSAER